MTTAVDHDDLTSILDIEEVRLAGDGARLAVVESRPDTGSNSYHRRVLVGPVEGPLDLVDAGGDGSTAMPRWTPGGRLVVVVRESDGTTTLLISSAGGSAPFTTLADRIPDPIQELSVSPDGRRVLFVVREPTDREWFETPEDRRPPLRLTSLRYREDGIGWTVNTRRQAYLVPIGGGEPARLTDGDHDDFHFGWHPDGGSVFFVSQRHPRADRTTLNDVFRMSVGAAGVAGVGGEPERLTNTDAEFAWPTCSPDGSTVSLNAIDVANYPEPVQLGVLDLASRSWRLAETTLDRDTHASAVVWTAQDRLATLVDRAGRTELVEIDITAGGHRVLLGGTGRVTAFDLRGDRLVAVRSGVTEPPRVLSGRVRGAVTDESVVSGAVAESAGVGEPGVDGAVVDGDSSDSSARLGEVHAPNAGFIANRVLAEAEYRSVQTSADTRVDSWLVRPVQGDGAATGAGALPLIVWLQGGGSQTGEQWSHEVQLLAARGFAVLYLNARGSAGYGTAWMRTVSGPRAASPGRGWGTVDVADVASVVEQTVAAVPELDGGRVGVMGGSYGGLVTTHLLAQTDLFAAGWAERGPYNLYSDAGTKDEAPWFFEAYLGDDHRADPGSYWDASPLRLADRITAPLAIVHSEHDYRCTIGQAEELFMALKLLDREVEFVRFPGEGHSLTRNGTPVHRLQRLHLLTDWFGRHLRP